MEQVQVRLLGGFSVEAGVRKINDSVNRAQKPLLVIAYLICNRARIVRAEELMRLCWEGEGKDDPANALRVVLHRARLMVDKLEIGSGMDVIRRERDGFRWISCQPVSVDAEEFVRLHEEGRQARDEAEKLECFLKAIHLYRGDFMGRNSGSAWGRFMVSQYRVRYFEMSLAALKSLSDNGEKQAAVQLARQVLALEPHYEAACRQLMEDLMSLGQAQAAVDEYEKLRVLLLRANRSSEEETRKVYFRAVRLCVGVEIPVELRRSGDDKNRGKNGARVCDFSFFRTFYPTAEYLIMQCGLEVYNALFTVEEIPGREVSRRTMERAMDGLMWQLKEELKRGSALTRCANNQLLAMLGANGYEQACMCCEQQVEKFYQNHPPHLVRVRYGVWQVGGDKEI